MNIVEPKPREQSKQIDENGSVKKELRAKREVCDNRELGAAHFVQEKTTEEISPNMVYPIYNFSWAGEQSKGASP